MEHDYPPRLSVDELRGELDAYLEYRRTGGADRKVQEPTITADRIHISQFLGWLETGRAGNPDYEAMAADFLARQELRDPGGEKA